MAGCAPSVLRRFRECEDLLLLAGLTNTHQEWLHWAYAEVLVGFYSGYIREITVEALGFSKNAIGLTKWVLLFLRRRDSLDF